ncbi:MAG: hypothetical protein IKW50_05985 [Oscillospiraceae bacterium]|nr:hypothetical protein [Oscillospiraceae bacterium]
MSNELDKRRESSLQAMMDMECMPVMPELDLAMSGDTKIPLAELSALGVAFQPIASAIQTVVSGGGSSGIYFVNTMGKQMFTTSGGTEFIGSLQTAAGTVGGGQARLTELACDPTMLFMAAALMSIEKKLDTIQETQEEILDYLEVKERAKLQGNLNTLGEVMTNFKYNWDNQTYKNNKHILVQQIKKDSEESIVLYRDQIAKKLKKRSFIHSDHDVKGTLQKLETQFKDYQLALYLYSYSTFLEVMLLGNFGKGYLDSAEQRITEYSLQYRTLYTECYNLMEDYSKSSIQAGVLTGLAVASKFMGEAIAKVPVISNSQLDENLIEAGYRLDKHGSRRATVALEGLAQSRMSVTLPFIENIRAVNDLYNKPVIYLFDGNNMYVRQLAG